MLQLWRRISKRDNSVVSDSGAARKINTGKIGATVLHQRCKTAIGKIDRFGEIYLCQELELGRAEGLDPHVMEQVDIAKVKLFQWRLLQPLQCRQMATIKVAIFDVEDAQLRNLRHSGRKAEISKFRT